MYLVSENRSYFISGLVTDRPKRLCDNKEKRERESEERPSFSRKDSKSVHLAK